MAKKVKDDRKSNINCGGFSVAISGDLFPAQNRQWPQPDEDPDCSNAKSAHGPACCEPPYNGHWTRTLKVHQFRITSDPSAASQCCTFSRTTFNWIICDIWFSFPMVRCRNA